MKPDETKEERDQRLRAALLRLTNRAPDPEPASPIQATPEKQPEAKGYVGGMNLAQRIVLIAGFLIVLATALFPPWLYVYKYPGLPQAERPAGYFLIFQQHAPQDRAALAALFGLPPNNDAQMLEEASPRFFSLQLDRTRLAVQIGATLILMTILYLALRPAKRRLIP